MPAEPGLPPGVLRMIPEPRWAVTRRAAVGGKLRVGDEFEIGSVKGKVVSVGPKYIELEMEEDRRFTLKPAGVLREAADRAMED